jgi:hypothetical protein
MLGKKHKPTENQGHFRKYALSPSTDSPNPNKTSNQAYKTRSKQALVKVELKHVY